MIIQKYLIINHRGNVRLAQREPTMSGNEIALRLELELPNELFKRPTLQAYMKVPSEAVPRTKITAAITDNVQKIIKEATGLNMVVSIVEQPKDEKK